ncbi:MAG: DNA-binding protein [Candidatus Syntrophonatronum acetioxidans]|uniref:DNA-binding protein n=1 Tax=Candidatus Syntrophonatronum acetioxidans TaxID=1795816 RepID=A0A424YF83_9FIRM|nr:MAG: DNA-binding protein [Candidatus Syntrophonatronum acetioxidans]
MNKYNGDLPLVLNVPQLSKILGINKTSAYQLAKSKDFPSLKVGKRIIIPRDAFFEWLSREAWGSK